MSTARAQDNTKVQNALRLGKAGVLAAQLSGLDFVDCEELGYPPFAHS
ncbi:hypothetical protein [Novosphingobium sp. Gsoil 351]|nr:hypothetical protein [Novosphingobium sp. Gsoil 351]